MESTEPRGPPGSGHGSNAGRAFITGDARAKRSGQRAARAGAPGGEGAAKTGTKAVRAEAGRATVGPRCHGPGGSGCHLVGKGASPGSEPGLQLRTLGDQASRDESRPGAERAWETGRRQRRGVNPGALRAGHRLQSWGGGRTSRPVPEASAQLPPQPCGWGGHAWSSGQEAFQDIPSHLSHTQAIGPGPQEGPPALPEASTSRTIIRLRDKTSSRLSLTPSTEGGP